MSDGQWRVSSRLSRAIFVAITLFAASCAPPVPTAGSLIAISEIGSPAGAASAQPNLSKTADGRFILSWLEPGSEKNYALRFALSQEGGWSKPYTVTTDLDKASNSVDFPAVVGLSNGGLAAHWNAKVGNLPYATHIQISFSSDEGKSWSEVIIPHRDRTQTEHGFASLAESSDGGLSVVWIDGRETAFNKDKGYFTGQMALRGTTVKTGATLGQEFLLDERVCDCCHTSSALTSNGLLVAYRDRSEREVRDISIARFKDGRWIQSSTPSNDNWHIEGCPINGPAISAEGDQVALAWYTDANESARVYVAFSNDGGETFGKPFQVDDGNPGGRVDVVTLPDGGAFVTWIEMRGVEAEMRARRIRRDGRRLDSQTLGAANKALTSGFSRIERIRDKVMFAWTDVSNPSRVRTVIASVRN
jgi:hypothetical protein